MYVCIKVDVKRWHSFLESLKLLEFLRKLDTDWLDCIVGVWKLG